MYIIGKNWSSNEFTLNVLGLKMENENWIPILLIYKRLEVKKILNKGYKAGFNYKYSLKTIGNCTINY